MKHTLIKEKQPKNTLLIRKLSKIFVDYQIDIYICTESNFIYKL